MADLSKLSDADLEAVASGDMSKVSESGLNMLAGAESSAVKPQWSDLPNNIIPSAKKFVKDLATPIMHPIDTAKTLGKTAVGTAQLLMPGQQEYEAYPKAIAGAMADRYGSLEGLKKTAIEDPVGMMSDIGTLFTGGGALSKVGGLTKTAKAFDTAAKFVDPISLAGQVSPLNILAHTLPDNMIEGLYMKTIKPKTGNAPALNIADARKALDNGILPNIGGLNKIKSKLDANKTTLDDIIDSATIQGKEVDISLVNSQLDGIRQRIVDEAVNPGPVLDMLDNIQSNLLAHQNTVGNMMPVDKAQALKRGLDYKLRKEWGKMSSAEANLDKATRQALNDQIVTVLQQDFPELSKLNKDSHELMNLKKAIEPAINRIRNRDPFGAGLLWATAAGSAAGNAMGRNDLFLATVLTRVLTSEPAVASRLAVALNKRKHGITETQTSVAKRMARAVLSREARQAGVMSGRINNMPASDLEEAMLATPKRVKLNMDGTWSD